jgi:hypothetical protein
MKKIIVMLMLVLGLTFIYNPQTNVGFVYVNDSPSNWIILVDVNSNVLRYYQAVPGVEERLDYGFDRWLKDKVDKGFPFKSTIIPFPGQQKRR